MRRAHLSAMPVIDVAVFGIMSLMLPTEVPTLSLGSIQLRPFRQADAGVVMSVTTDPLIP
ncbi:hypothetical protein Aca07nite_38960 [Actinoplanes capillaceus]|uniref:Uncharacterized protein n=1 Tax=Actinoplanes campanulatus TaxID=113559 RepID=A0ABQ3WK56_9ACTN|nr:hypothetical protein Aca07nite_38960 [Actinoplanes capillaceus]